MLDCAHRRLDEGFEGDCAVTRALSVWRPEPDSESGVAPDELLPRLSAEDVQRVADYLDAGAVVARTTARMVDPWSDDESARVPLMQRTDGVWRWDDAVSYFVRRYGLSPGAEFLEYVRARGFAPPAVSDDQVSAVIDEVFGVGPAAAPQRVVRLDGSQLLPRDYYCVYRGRVFRYYDAHPDIRLAVAPGEPVPEGFELEDDRRAFVQAIAYKTVPVSAVDGFYRVITACRYKGTRFSIVRIDGPRLRLNIGGGRRVKRVAEPVHPTFHEWGSFPNVEVLGMGEIWATIDIAEAAQITMAVVPYHVVSGELKPVRDPTGVGRAVPTADEIFYFPSPADSPYLPPDDALAVVRGYLDVNDPRYPATGLVPARLRDGWRMDTHDPVGIVYYASDDGQILSAPADVPESQVSSQLSADYRRRHPFVNPPPAHDSGNDIFD